MAKTKTGSTRSTTRREEIRRLLPKPSFKWTALMREPAFVHSSLIIVGFLLITSLVVNWSREQVKVRDGQIMTSTRIKRVDYQVTDEEATATLREEARKSSPRIYVLNESFLDRLEAALLGLPKAVAGKTSLSDIAQGLVGEFKLTQSDLEALQKVTREGEPTADWIRWVRKLVHEKLIDSPLIRSQEYQVFITTNVKTVHLPDGKFVRLDSTSALEISSERATGVDVRLQDVIASAGFPTEFLQLVFARVTGERLPTLVFAPDETEALAKAAGENVSPVRIDHKKGEVLYRRGDQLSPEQYTEVLTEWKQWKTQTAENEPMRLWFPRLGVAGLIAFLTLFLGSFARIGYPRIIHNPLRLTAICGLTGGLLAMAAVFTVYAPIFLYPAALASTLFVAILIVVAYDQKLAILLASMQAVLITLALQQTMAVVILLVAGSATAVSLLPEVRHRHSLIRAATLTAIVIVAGTVLWGMVEIPRVAGANEQIFVMALAGGLTCYGVGFLTLGMLPSFERLFDIVTGMTLAELRDPKRPLLRQLQQRAPGTYNHSLQVANISEAAAEAIGADGLLVYVGALYHDIGKINKPEYFVENQTGQSKHEKLSPAMSLLVILGHVKNGVELAKEYALPRPIIHFIESHHGTTLVEYFYHAAKSKAEDAKVSEVEYRYPGPKPSTKEAAILMLADAVESSARAMAEPNPSRIENLVRSLSKKRLEDGQFNECALSFRELHQIEDAIIARMLAIYHSRISYPSARSEDKSESGRGSQPRTATG